MKPLAYYLQIGAAISSLYVGLIYIFYNWKKGLFHRLLGTNFIIMSMGLIVNFVSMNNYFLIFPHLSRTGFLFMLLMPPILYFSIFRGFLRKPFKKTDLIHFLPLLIYIINFLPYFIKSGEEKVLLLREHNIGTFNEGWLFRGYFIPILLFSQTIYYILVFSRKIKEFPITQVSEAYIKFFYYFKTYLILHFSSLLLIFIDYFLDLKVGYMIALAYALINTIFFLKVISTPEWIFSDSVEEENNDSLKSPSNVDKILEQINMQLTPTIGELTKLEQLTLKEITHLCDKDSLFLEADFQQKNLAKALNCSEYKVRILLEKAYGLNFVEFNNHLKIKHFLINYKRKEGSWKLLKMSIISEKLGYKSLNSFYLNFKKITGLTPGDFFNSNKIDNVK